MDVSYRILEPENSAEYRRIRMKSLKEDPECFCAEYEEQAKLEKLYFESRIETNSQGDFMAGAFQDVRLVGICGFMEKSDHFDAAGTIVQMYVLPELRRQGIGRGLVQFIRHVAIEKKVISRICLEVLRRNDSAVRVYEKCGFEKAELPDHDDQHWIMVCELAGYPT